MFSPYGTGRRCALPNFEHFSRKMDSQRHYWRRYLYAEYEQACEREGFRAYSFNSFCRELLAWRKQARAEQTGEWYPAERATTYWSTIGEREGRLDLFVAQLTSSDMTFCLASKGRSYRDWMRCCAAAYEYFGGVPYVTCCPYPSLSRDGAATLEAFAAHFRTVLYGARPKSMKTAVRRGGLLDEKGSSFVASHVRADFAHVAFRSEDDANALIVGRADLYNSTSFGGEPSRRALFEEAEAELLLLLPEGGYGFDRWARRTVQRDHHFLYGRVRYSVPFRYAFEEVRVRIADGAIEAYHMGELVARHVMPGKGTTARTVTDESHRPPGHRWFAKRVERRFLALASELGPWVVKAMKVALRQCRSEGRGFKRCKELIDLSKEPSHITLDEACRKAIGSGDPLSVEAVRLEMAVRA